MDNQLKNTIEQALIEIDEVDSLEIYPEKQVISWLRALLEENKLLRESKLNVEHNRTLLSAELQQTREELARAKWEDEQFTWLRDQVSVCAKENESLRTELSAKDKVLEWYASTGHQLAKDILSKYRGDTHE